MPLYMISWCVMALGAYVFWGTLHATLIGLLIGMFLTVLFSLKRK